MTTVCFDGNVLAADSLSTTLIEKPHLHCPSCKTPAPRLQRAGLEKIKTGFTTSFRGSPILAVAGSGRVDSYNAAVQLLRQGLPLIEILEGAPTLLAGEGTIPAFALIIVTEAEAWKLTHSAGKTKVRRYREGELWIIGSCDPKVTALANLIYTDVSAVSMVSFAAMVDPNTGGAIYYGERDQLRKGELQKQELAPVAERLQGWSTRLRHPAPVPEAPVKKSRKRRGDQ